VGEVLKFSGGKRILRRGGKYDNHEGICHVYDTSPGWGYGNSLLGLVCPSCGCAKISPNRKSGCVESSRPGVKFPFIAKFPLQIHLP